jgi:aminoglycoside phosphotransferase family enzyme
MKTGVVSQDRLLAFLRDPRSYPDHPRRIRILETHASWVVLTARHAYKVKKPVNFGFLDFSNAQKTAPLLRARGDAQSPVFP